MNYKKKPGTMRDKKNSSFECLFDFPKPCCKIGDPVLLSIVFASSVVVPVHAIPDSWTEYGDIVDYETN